MKYQSFSRKCRVQERGVTADGKQVTDMWNKVSGHLGSPSTSLGAKCPDILPFQGTTRQMQDWATAITDSAESG